MTAPILPETEAAFFDALRDDDPYLLYDTAPCGYLSMTPDGLITKANRTLLALLGRRHDDVVGRLHFTDLLTAGGRIYHETHYAPMLRMHDSAHEIALELLREDGSRVSVLVNSVLDRTPDGRPVMIRAAVFDATQRRSYERELQREKERAEAAEAHALELARTLQQTLLPPSPPRITHLDVGAVFRAGAVGVDVGGDFYDVFQVGPSEWVVIIGDVCGKGIEAALVATLTRYTLRAMCVEYRSPAEALRRTNDVLRAHATARFCSAACVRLRRPDGHWQATVSSAGHPLPLLRNADAAVVVLGKPGTLLNVLAEPLLHDTDFSLPAGSRLLMCTDGLAEGRVNGEFYGEDRIAEKFSAAEGTAQDVAQAILDDNLTFQGGLAKDDIAVVVLASSGDGGRV
jgi:sigma-B regulation protein RsbU (phosphoserine phosphatase)